MKATMASRPGFPMVLAAALLGAGMFAWLTPVPSGGNDFDVVKGAIVIRAGNANENANYANEPLEANKDLSDLSVQCSGNTRAKINNNNIKKYFEPLQHRNVTNVGVANATTIIKQGGTIVTSANKNNEYHCTVRGISVAKIKGVFRIFPKPTYP